jgi:para-aminobenzoate synthetase/4-amino-4-deoxychorismate lyase
MKSAYSPIFETYLVVDGKPLEEQLHVGRMRDITGVDSTDYLHEIAGTLPDYYRLRIDCMPPGVLSSDATPLDTPSILNQAVQPFDLVSRQFSGDMIDVGRGGFKLSDRGVLEVLEAESSPAIPLMIDGRNNLLETTRQNIFVVEGDTIVTPPLDGRILPGITRAVVLSLAADAGITHAETEISLERALQSDGLFMTNALSGISWAEHLDDTSWPEIPAIVRTLHGLLAERWKEQLNGRS